MHQKRPSSKGKGSYKMILLQKVQRSRAGTRKRSILLHKVQCNGGHNSEKGIQQRKASNRLVKGRRSLPPRN
ncbi:hypothetical protein BK133_04525 [Paenibacillus sp. FSL H8-0548]|nr:hypothetical protein BK133_04525 [Paenibacillus sp. FSL H8-0548]